MQIWPPKSVKDSGSRFHTKLKEAIMQVVCCQLQASAFIHFGSFIYWIVFFIMTMEVLLFVA